MTLVKIGCVFGLLVLMCGQILFWRRRDNILAYIQGALFLVTIFIPMFGTDLLDRHDPDTVRLYATLIMIGGGFYLAGLCAGSPLGNRPAHPDRMTFTGPIVGKLMDILRNRARILAVFGGLSLGAGYLLMGYAPLLAADRQAAKFGIGPYAAGLERGAIVYRLGLAVSSIALPIVITLVLRNKRLLDLTLALGLFGGLVLSMSRGLAFSGILMAAIAMGIERRVRPGLVMLLVTLAFAFSSVGNDLMLGNPVGQGGPIASRLAANAPDLFDHLGFLYGFERSGRQTQGWALIAGGLSLKPGYYNPSTFALRTMYGPGAETLPSGGIRLPAPIWGYVSYGFAGAAVWSFLAGLFAGWGTVRVRRMLDDMVGMPGSALNMVVAAVYFTGTYGVLSNFYFATSAMALSLALAIYLGRVLGRPTAGEPKRYLEGTRPRPLPTTRR